MTNTEFKEELKILISSHRMKLLRLKKESSSDILKERLKRSEEMLDKLEQDYFHKNITESIVNADLINKREIDITDQVEQGLLKIFNEYVETGYSNLSDSDFKYEQYSTSLCQIADRLLQIESDRKMTNSLRGI